MQASHSTSKSYPPASPHAATAEANAICDSVLPCSSITASARASRVAASRIAAGATDSKSSRTVPPVMNCRITASEPDRETPPESGTTSWVMMRSSVLLPAPFAPIKATRSPCPTLNDTSLSSERPSASANATEATSR